MKFVPNVLKLNTAMKIKNIKHFFYLPDKALELHLVIYRIQLNIV